MDREQTRSDRCRLELQIQNSQKLESLGELASGISHNFRNILAGIIANCQLLEMRCPDYTDLRKNLTGIHNLAQIGSELVNNLLKFARKGNGKEKQIFNLAEVLEETVQIITPSFDKNITINGDWENPLPMEGVRSELSQLVMNLCTNARDAMGEGGILQITARPLPAKDKIYLAVSDTGSGMDESIRKRIFEPFFTTKEPGRGTGLGLSTAYGIVRDHEGEITVNSKPGVGSIFQILFPMAEVRGVEKKAPPMEIIEGRGERVLVIDDDRGLLQTVEALMAGIGYQAVTTESGQRGIELYCSDPPDVVLIDRSMPETDGITAAGEILSFDPKARIIIVSGYEEEGPNALEEPIKSRIRAYVTKPFDISDLSRVLADVLRDGDDRRAERCSNP
jgi:CheY-like chemotaxis protein